MVMRLRPRLPKEKPWSWWVLDAIGGYFEAAFIRTALQYTQRMGILNQRGENHEGVLFRRRKRYLSGRRLRGQPYRPWHTWDDHHSPSAAWAGDGAGFRPWGRAMGPEAKRHERIVRRSEGMALPHHQALRL